MNNLAELFPDVRGSKIETPQKTKVRSSSLPSGITSKMDIFARNVAEGLSLADAYRRAFNTANMKPRTISNDASRLAQQSGVRAAIEAYRAEIEERNRISSLERDKRIWESLWAIIDDEKVPPAVIVKALDLAARLAGMFRSGDKEQPLSSDQIEAEIRERLSSLP